MAEVRMSQRPPLQSMLGGCGLEPGGHYQVARNATITFRPGALTPLAKTR